MVPPKMRWTMVGDASELSLVISVVETLHYSQAYRFLSRVTAINKRIMAETELSAREGPVVLITGCSKGGIGHGLALEFAKRGCRVVATARKLSSMSSLETVKGVVMTLEMDILEDESVAKGVGEVLATFTRIDVLINNAGVHCVGPVAELPLSQLETTFSTNVFGTMRVIGHVVPRMLEERRGKIVNVGSVVTMFPSPWVGAYAASKAAVHSLSDSLRVELKPFGIDVITVVPGAIKSNLGLHSAEVYKCNPQWKFYKPFENAIYRRITVSQEPGCTPTEKFAAKVAEAVLRKKSPPWFSYGKFSTVAGILFYLPMWLRDFIAMKFNGL